MWTRQKVLKIMLNTIKPDEVTTTAELLEKTKKAGLDVTRHTISNTFSTLVNLGVARNTGKLGKIIPASQWDAVVYGAEHGLGKIKNFKNKDNFGFIGVSEIQRLALYHKPL